MVAMLTGAMGIRQDLAERRSPVLAVDFGLLGGT